MTSFEGSHSHLFRGARLTANEAGMSLPLRACQLWLTFSDGIEVQAELLTGHGAGEVVLSVPTYRTAAGHQIKQAIWPVIVSGNETPHRLILKLGQRLPNAE
jgi:hypothetical protein